MDTLELKNILISKISEIDDIQYLEAIMTILESKTSSINYNENYNEELFKAEEDITAGRLYTQSQAKDKIKEWKKEIIWTETALNQLQEIYFYLLETSKSESIASRVTDTLLDSTDILKRSWEIYERDEMKIPKSEEYRAYEIFSYRISYKIEGLSIIILRVRHTSRNLKPL